MKKCVFLIGGPGSGKDYVLRNIFSRFDLTEVNADQFISGNIQKLSEKIVLNGANTLQKIRQCEKLLEGYEFEYVSVSVSDKVSKARNIKRESPISEEKRIERMQNIKILESQLEGVFSFNNSINLTESSEMEQMFFASQIEKLLEKLIDSGLSMNERRESEYGANLQLAKTFDAKKQPGHYLTKDGIPIHDTPYATASKALQAWKESKIKNSLKIQHFSENLDEEFQDFFSEDQDLGVDVTPTLSKNPGRKKNNKTPGDSTDMTLQGMPVTSTAFAEAIEYHKQNDISLVENAYRPGSDMFFALVLEAKERYKNGEYEPANEFERDLLEGNIGETDLFEGEEIILEFPFLEESDEEPSLGKPFREKSGGAVYVKDKDGNVIKVKFSQSGMEKKFKDPKRVRSFMARHRCLANKDKTSSAYWACRYPRYFSNSGQQWW